MGLDPDVFWMLTMHEFWIKHRAFSRAEDRARSLVLELVSLTTTRKKKADQAALERAVHGLRRYPVKKWLMET